MVDVWLCLWRSITKDEYLGADFSQSNHFYHRKNCGRIVKNGSVLNVEEKT